MKSKDYDIYVKPGRSRLRPRSTVFDDGLDRAERRQNRRADEKRLIEEELLIDEILNEEELDDYYDAYFANDFVSDEEVN